MTLKEYYKEILNTLLTEDTETTLRNAENNKAIKNLEGKAKEKKRIWNEVSDPHSDLPPHSDSPEAYKASWNRRMTRAYKASDKFVAAREKLDARIALQQKEQASKFRIGLGGKIVKEDIETPLRNAENNKAIKKLEGKAKEKMLRWATSSSLQPRSYRLAGEYVAAREKLEARVAKQEAERKSKFRIGLGGKRRKTK